MSTARRWRAFGPTAALLELDDLDAVLGLRARIEDERDAGRLVQLLEVVPAARTLLLRCATPQDLGTVAADVDRLEPLAAADRGTGLEPVRLAVRYDGPDLEDVADLLGIEPAEVRARHLRTRWTVAFTGFAPGFGYLVADGDSGLEVPRLEQPRTSVPAGAVGLAGEFSGVYPRSSPGGWRLIGTCSTPTWDEDRDPPAVLRPGTRVVFEESP
ncbi:allophanate hydrolase subunit 1 [Aeromicrobium halocynthiae]|uniref:Allophanate hydrolase subunit 1 n=1 Tax=Aeromicrobium halocynthiae TaxID=560557 RepID=A0ABP5HR62_9ACTN